MSRVIVVSNRLPVNITEEAGKLKLNRTIGGLATALGSVIDTYPMLWIGWPGNQQSLSKSQLLTLQFPEGLVPVSITASQVKRYYNHMANGIFWPILHGVKPSKLGAEADWSATRKVTQKFAKAIKENLQPDDVIWIHDYHLVLLPRLLRDMGVENRIGFFLHTPFPNADTFLKWRFHDSLLDSLTQVDVLGFQTERDVKHYRECLSAVGMKMKRKAVIKAFPIGVDFKSYRSANKLLGVKDYLTAISNKVIGKKVVLSVSRLDYTKGIVEQVYAIENLLKIYKPGKLLYKLVVAPSRESLDEYQKLKDDIADNVKRINTAYKKEHGIKPIEYEYRSYGFEELNAWYRIADALLVASKQDGMNLIVKEYIAAHEGYSGTVVLSKTIGAASQLKKAILVDPDDVSSITEGLITALTMSFVEKTKRWRALRSNVRKEDVFWWARTFLEVLVKQ